MDQLLQYVWKDEKSKITGTNIRTTKSKNEVMNQVQLQMEKDEAETRNELKRTQDSESSKNIQELRITRSKIKKWISSLKKDRYTQSTLVTTITDTAYRMYGERLSCPHCPGQTLSLNHVAQECPYLIEDRRDAFAYARQDHKGRKGRTDTDLMSTHVQIRNVWGLET